MSINNVEAIEYVSFHIMIDKYLKGDDVTLPEKYAEVLPYVSGFVSDVELAFDIIVRKPGILFTIEDKANYFTLVDYTTRLYDVDYIKVSTIDWGDIEYDSYVYDGSANLFFTVNDDFYENPEEYRESFIIQSVHCLVDQYFTVKEEREQYGDGMTIVDKDGNIKKDIL